MHTVLMAFVDTASLCLSQWDDTINYSDLKKLVFFSLRKKFSDVLERESQTNYENHTYKKRVQGRD